MKADPGHIATNAAISGARPCIKLEIRWDGVNWVDESAYLVAQASGGKALSGPGEGLLGMGNGGATATAMVDNRAGRYSVYHAGSQANTYGLYGKLVRISAGYYYGATPEYAKAFTGRVTDVIEHEASGVAQLTLQDIASAFEQVKVSTPLYTDLRTDQWIATLCSALGLSSYNLERGIGLIPHCWLEEDFALAEIRSAAQSEGGVAFFDDEGELQFWNATHWIGKSSVATISYGEMQPRTDYQNVANIVGVEYQPRQAGQPTVVYTLERPVYVRASGSVTITCQFKLPLATFQGYSMRATAGGDDRSADIAVAPTTPQYAGSWVVTFTNAATRQGLWVTSFDVYGEPLSGRPAEQHVHDASGSNVDWRRDFRGNLNLQTAGQARMLAAMTASRLALPRLTLTLTDLRANPLLELGDIVTVAGARTGISTTAMILGISWQFGTSYRMGLEVADFTDFYAYSDYWKVGTSNVGSGSVWL